MLKDLQELREQIDGGDLGTGKLVCENQCGGTGTASYVSNLQLISFAKSGQL
jgi:hypothetical protein